MATQAIPNHPGPDHLITIKVQVNEDSHRRFKLPLRDLRATVLPQKLRHLLNVPAESQIIFERYSDSAAAYIQLDNENVSVYKQLYRAAKAKSKLRLKATITDPSPNTFPNKETAEEPLDTQAPARHNYLQTVLSPAVPATQTETAPAADETVAKFSISAEPPQPAKQAGCSSSMTSPQYRRFEVNEDTLPFPAISHHTPRGMFCIDCNNCRRSIPNEHYHCSICEGGDYDLCTRCVIDGASCLGEGHWLIKRSVVDGVVTNSTTETIPPRQPQMQQALASTKLASDSVAAAPAVPEKVVENTVDLTAAVPQPTDDSKTPDMASHGDDKPVCNGCCNETDESNLVRCNDCEDYDLCLRCLLRNKHGHHPAHTFHLGTDHNFCLKNLIMSRCLPGRQFKHGAICDGCEKTIHGTRHKCLTCPDWDYCRDCFKSSPQTHPGHRFAPLYESISEPPREHMVHYGIFCDGPLCKDKPAQSYIQGDRYKCTICDDLDFCANCEALPTLAHNRTHPLIKFRTHIRSVSVSTAFEDTANGNVWMNDKCLAHAYSRFTADTNVEEKPSVERAPVEVDASKPASVADTEAPVAVTEAPITATTSPPAGAAYQAYFMRDTIADGTQLPPSTPFTQTWTLYNPGPKSWPAGCDVRFVGGDSMLDVDTSQPCSMSAFSLAMESNKLTSTVEPGNSADFTVRLRTPSRECTAISYWRLKLPNGEPVGHRLWCDVRVRASAQPVEAAESTTNEAPSVNAEPQESAMIFPKLEKESPESSTHEAMEPARTAPTVSSASEGDVLEDVESLTLDDANTDDGFLTDEEYDVLDASDQEFIEAKQSVQ